MEKVIDGFRPLSRGLFFNGTLLHLHHGIQGEVFVPFLGDFFSIACLRNPCPSALASTFAAGMDQPLHQALSFGDEMPIFPVRAGIGGDRDLEIRNEKLEMVVRRKKTEAPQFFRNRSSRIAKPLPLGKGPPEGRGIGRKMCRQRVSKYGADYGMCRTESVTKQT